MGKWRKTGKDIWKKHKVDQWVYITWYGSQDDIHYDVRLTSKRDEGGKSLAKGFRTRTQAMDFADAYMTVS